MGSIVSEAIIAGKSAMQKGKNINITFNKDKYILWFYDSYCI